MLVSSGRGGHENDTMTSNCSAWAPAWPHVKLRIILIRGEGRHARSWLSVWKEAGMQHDIRWLTSTDFWQTVIEDRSREPLHSDATRLYKIMQWLSWWGRVVYSRLLTCCNQATKIKYTHASQLSIFLLCHTGSERGTVISMSVCSRISETKCPDSRNFICTCYLWPSRGWRKCNMPCTSGFVDDDMLSKNGAYTDQNCNLCLLMFPHLLIPHGR